MIAGVYVSHWLNLFSVCYEFHTDGGQIKKKQSRKGYKLSMTGYYHRLCLPELGSVLQQQNIVMDILGAVKMELTDIYEQRLKHG